MYALAASAAPARSRRPGVIAEDVPNPTPSDYRMKTEAYRSVSNSFVSWTLALAHQNQPNIRPETPSINSASSHNHRHGSGTILSVGFGTSSAMTPGLRWAARHGLTGTRLLDQAREFDRRSSIRHAGFHISALDIH